MGAFRYELGVNQSLYKMEESIVSSTFNLPTSKADMPFYRIIFSLQVDVQTANHKGLRWQAQLLLAQCALVPQSRGFFHLRLTLLILRQTPTSS